MGKISEREWGCSVFYSEAQWVKNTNRRKKKRTLRKDSVCKSF